MKIYTKAGDKGETTLLGGQRLFKDALRIEAYGTVDELNSALGLARTSQPPRELDEILVRIQSELFTLGAELAAGEKVQAAGGQQIGETHVAGLEQDIDVFEARLTPLANFILPGGSVLAAQLHLSRTICRRAERYAVRLSREERVPPLCIVYLNRLSDLMFVLARHANQLAGIADVPWIPRPKR